MSLADEVRMIIAEQFDIDVTELTNETSFIKDLKADSLDLTELILNLEEKLEEKFGIRIPDEDAEKITTVGEAVNYIEEKARAAAER